MPNKVLDIDLSDARDSESVHNVFKLALGFPDFYGNNWSAWVDCMTDLDEPDTGMTNVHVCEGDILVLNMKNVETLKRSSPDDYAALLECSAFVNYRRIDIGLKPVLALSFYQ